MTRKEGEDEVKVRYDGEHEGRESVRERWVSPSVSAGHRHRCGPHTQVLGQVVWGPAPLCPVHKQASCLGSSEKRLLS